MGTGTNSKRDGRLSQEAIVTLVNHGLFQFGNALSAVFINLYLWRLTNDLWINGVFNLITLLAAPIATIFVGKLAKQKDRLLAYRTGIYMTAFFYLCILIVQERMVDYYIVFALLKGVSTAFYWLGQFTMIYEVSSDDTRYRYLGWNLVINNIALLAGPAIAGLLIGTFEGLKGYGWLPIVLILVMASQIGIERLVAPIADKKRVASGKSFCTR
ncbi:MFS transporter [Paenibacillus sp. YYML68]|uniref:MFS transporter n=1 Tax=Paenibacillus sp. YYML68 TaxID=2909250 RepID=UPI002492F980|nr:MFS transporter [Paenibacillus sp. YYML68]